LLWWGASNLFFTFTVSPPAVAQTPEPILLNEGAVVEGVDFDGDKETKTDVTSRFTSRPITIPPAGSTTLAAQVYAGAKNREAFQSIANADYLGREYMQQIREGYGSCTFSFLTDGMIWLLNKLERIFNNFGVAIIVLVLIVRTILHPITKRTQVNMMRMQQNMASVQPKMDELRKRFANEPLKLNQEMMKLYREEGISPVGQMGGCLPMLLQMPILFALYSSLRNNVAMRGRGFILWINDLTAPDVLVDFGRTIHIPLLGDMTGLHLLPILVGVMMFAQQKLMPKPKRPVKQSSSAQAEQMEQMQKIMPYMSLIMIPVFYKLASGLNIYMMATSIIGMLEQWQIRKHISKEELKAPVHKPKPDKPRRGMAFFEKIMKQAEEAQKLKSNRDPRNKK
jgi:YidC/Oxa1 family membrane protein insertase